VILLGELFMRFKAYLLSFLILVFSFPAFADPAPLVMLKQVSSQMIAELERNKGRLSTQVIDNIVHRILLPHVDLESMSRSVVGRQYWMQATPAQREQFKREFTNVVIQVYSAPLSSYNGEIIEFKPSRDSTTASRIQVQSIITRKNGQKIPVNYRLVQSGGSWKVYDFSVEGISMVSSYRSQFDNILQQQGMDGLLQRLRQQQGKKL
jgi:phospholipid transport system substrate-binding protein